MVSGGVLFLLFIGVALALPPREPKLIWEDNFDTLDEGRWRHLVTAWNGGNWEFQYYRNNRKNSYVDNGTLKIQPTPANQELSDQDIRYGTINDPACNMDPCVSQGGSDSVAPVFSARLETQGIFNIGYGRIEIRAKLPRGDWLWPTLFMMPSEQYYGSWPRSGEIDIAESRGNRDLRDINNQPVGVNQVAHTLHWGPDEYQDVWPITRFENIKQSGDWSDEFHVYEIERTPDHIIYRIDGQETASVYPPEGGFWQLGGFSGNNLWASGDRVAPFDRPFYLILNVAVGGMYFVDSFINGGYPRPWDWNSGHPMLQFYDGQNQWYPTWDRPFEIDYVRVWPAAPKYKEHHNNSPSSKTDVKEKYNEVKIGNKNGTNVSVSWLVIPYVMVALQIASTLLMLTYM